MARRQGLPPTEPRIASPNWIRTPKAEAGQPVSPAVSSNRLWQHQPNGQGIRRNPTASAIPGRERPNPIRNCLDYLATGS